MKITIYHNPKCGTSRNTLAILQQAGTEPEVIEYLKTPPSRERLVELIAMMEMPVRDLLRRKGTPYEDLQLDDPKWSDDQLIDFMVQHPILMNRPVVVADKRAKLCRPSEVLLELLPHLDLGSFAKEDGQVITGISGNKAGKA
jgi:arsenate reductase (glutaredoxin)